ncbi:MAG TPA: multiheme c-type cytochrome [Planctomycetaceae bacterium]|nr:multiheme c-type cytochrome [Planctomycetaceae bacterium]
MLDVRADPYGESCPIMGDLLRVSVLVVAGCLAAGCGSAPSAVSSTKIAARVPLMHGPAECAACHQEQTSHYRETGHARTLSPASGEEFLKRFAPQSIDIQFDARSQTLRLNQRDGKVFISSDQFPDGLPMEWLFGSGRHAQTPVTTHVNPHSRETEAIQFFLTWFSGHGLGRTPGLGNHLGTESLLTIGSPLNLSGIHACFRCHSAELPMDGTVLQLDRVVPGVQCSNCHEDLAAHVTNQERVPPRLTRLTRLTPEKSVGICAECHRTEKSSIVTMFPNSPANTARFAPVGILKSACYLRQSKLQRFDCITCHDPHRPMETDPAVYDAKCAACHESPSLPTQCRDSTAAASCVACHMARVPAEAPLHFTEHWIRRPAGTARR